tara:strand:- start:43 stop:1194 length:1152 start_codon:yes stop_codon:yes gene_type:complete
MSPNCKKIWTRKYVVSKFQKNWVNNEWKKMNSKIMLDKEKALFPATMIEIEIRKKKDKYLQKINEIDKQIKVLEQKRIELKIKLGREERIKTEYIGKKCMSNECRGYLSKSMKCGLCEKEFCNKCFEEKSDGHVCDEKTVETIKMLSKDTKGCPKCNTMIHKIDGCDQMWCVQCHTGFSWRTGRIESRIHNPHYYEWQRNQNGGLIPRNLGDHECGRNLDTYVINLLNGIIGRVNNADKEYVKHHVRNIQEVVRKTIHLEEVDVPKFQTDIVCCVENRVKYLKGEINEKEFQSRLHAREKKNEKNRDLRCAFLLQIQGVTDITYRLIDDREKMSKKVFDNYLEEYYRLTEYSNSLLLDHSKTYGGIKYMLYYGKNRREVLIKR